LHIFGCAPKKSSEKKERNWLGRRKGEEKQHWSGTILLFVEDGQARIQVNLQKWGKRGERSTHSIKRGKKFPYLGAAITAKVLCEGRGMEEQKSKGKPSIGARGEEKGLVWRPRERN